MVKDGDRMIIERRKNGVRIMERVCEKCQKEFVGERNTCSQCRAQQWQSKFGPGYQKMCYHRRPGKVVVRPMLQSPERAAALERHQRRIRHNIEAITQAGFDPDRTPLDKILDAGVVIDDGRLTIVD